MNVASDPMLSNDKGSWISFFDSKHSKSGHRQLFSFARSVFSSLLLLLFSRFLHSYFNFTRLSAVLSFCFMRNNASPLNLIVSDEWFSIHCVKTMDYFIAFVFLSANAARIRFELNSFHEKRIKNKLFLTLLCFFLLLLQLKIGFQLPNKLKSIRLTTRRD